jgi:hypothetical protein
MPVGHGAKSGRKQEQAIAALLSEANVEAAALKVGIGYRTLKSWLKDREFLAAYRRARSAVVEGALGRLQQVKNGNLGKPGSYPPSPSRHFREFRSKADCTLLSIPAP